MSDRRDWINSLPDWVAFYLFMVTGMVFLGWIMWFNHGGEAPSPPPPSKPELIPT